MLTSEFGFAHPAGLVYVRKKNLFFVAQARRDTTRLLRLTPFERARGVLALPRIARPSTLAFDPARERVIAISTTKLAVVRSSSLDKGRSSVARTDIRYLGLRDPRAATFDPGTHRLLVLDAAAREIVGVPLAPKGATPVRVSLRSLGARTLRGLAFNPLDQLVYVASLDQELLYGLDRSGRLRKVFSLRSAAVESLTSMVFAPSTDPTDAPSVQHLFAADSGGPRALGRVAELSLEQSVFVRSAVTGRLVRTIPTWKLVPPVPDPSGIDFNPAADELVIADSEVEELPIFRGANLFFVNRAGALVRTGSTLAFSHEPTGIAMNPHDATLYVSDDDKRMVFGVRPGHDGSYGTQDDSVVRMSTAAFGSLDPEDVAIDLGSGHLFVADGVGTEVYGVDPVNGMFADGNDVVTHFDVARYGVRNVEGLGYDSRRRTLLVVADRERRIIELTRTGGLVRIINIGTIPGTRWLADVAVAPTSDAKDDPSAMSYWITDRQIDNGQQRGENDGRLYEVVLP